MARKLIIGLLLAGVLLLAVLVLVFASPHYPASRPEKVALMFIEATGKVALLSFKFHCGRFPRTEEGLRALVEAPTELEGVWKGPYLNVRWQDILKDPWGHAYRYVCPGIRNPERYDLWSLGPDGVESSDDIYESEKTKEPNQALQTTPMTRSVFDKTRAFEDQSRGV